MKKAMLLLGVLLLSVSCVELNGSLQVREAMSVKKKSGFLNLKTKTIKIEPGSYSAELKVKSQKNINLELKGGSLGEVDIPIKSEDSLNLPLNGQFYIEGRKIEQPFNVSGTITTNVDHWGYTDTTEKCERQITERRCEKVCVKETGKCDVVCKDVVITLYGLKDVSYHYKRTDREVRLEFMPENSTAVIASLPARGTESEKIIDRETICR
ncbi:hypothetical protein DOM21_15905 [Bacteriovorax stolpii]|uniref:hypothetical protein n=1 Tax=Bacteriovorax stolpii TaxID=960 RepID=UPI00115B3266|nr:hypothetical protein [Bacteriovorax stolpii]QDK42908.1 hypothetical protein DOM21_15905 [Bacteriovorax stolpii]